MKRKATAVWNGTGKEGSGHLTTQSTVLTKVRYSYTSRFSEGLGTNPEELLAAAHAGCFTMKLSFNLESAGFDPVELITVCEITLEAGAISHSKLDLTASVPGISSEQFDALVRDAEANCPVSKVLNAEISLTYVLNPKETPVSE